MCIINDYSNEIGISVDILNNKLQIECDAHDKVFESDIEINYCPMCGQKLGGV